MKINARGEKLFLPVFRWMCSIIALVTTFSAIRFVLALKVANLKVFFVCLSGLSTSLSGVAL
jgi:hypothetical protein